MTNPRTQDVTALFLFARAWYQSNPNEQIPVDDWERQKEAFSDEHGWVMYANDIACNGEGLDFIPILAAVSTGQVGLPLLKTCQHHSLQVYFLTDFKFSGVGQKEAFVTFDAGFETPLTMWNVSNEIIQALSRNKLSVEPYVRLLTRVTGKPHISIACLNSTEQKLWPKTNLELACRMPYVKRYGTFAPSPLSLFQNSGVNLDRYTDEKVLQMLERSGNLLDGQTRENALPTSFFFELFTRIDEGTSPNLDKIAQALNSIEDPEEISRISKLITKHLATDEHPWGVTKGVLLYRGLRYSLDHEKYGQIIDSTLLRVCATSLRDLDILMGISSGEVDAEEHLDVLRDSSKLLSKLVSEMSPLKAGDYAGQHFYALSRLLTDEFDAPDVSGIDLDDLVHKTILALEAYLDAHHVNEFSAETLDFKENAQKNVIGFVKSLSKHMDIDYSRYTGLNADSRIMLASAGFEVKKIPDLTRHDRGRVLSDQLGL